MACDAHVRLCMQHAVHYELSRTLAAHPAPRSAMVPYPTPQIQRNATLHQGPMCTTSELNIKNGPIPAPHLSLRAHDGALLLLQRLVHHELGALSLLLRNLLRLHCGLWGSSGVDKCRPEAPVSNVRATRSQFPDVCHSLLMCARSLNSMPYTSAAMTQVAGCLSCQLHMS